MPFRLETSRSKLSSLKLWKPRQKEKPNGSLFSWNIPQELLDYIIDFLHDDHSALACCSLVSRQWHASARYHLFSYIKLSGRQKVVDLVGYMHTSNSFSANLRNLQLIGQYPNLRPLVNGNVLSAILGSLPRLTHLSLAHLHLTNDIGTREPRTSPAPPPRFKLQLFALIHVGGVPHHSAEHFLNILALFTEIDTLVFEYTRFEHRSLMASDIGGHLDTTLSHMIPKALRVKRFIIQDVNFETKFWLEVLRRTTTIHTMTSLHILSPVRWDASSAGLLLTAVGSNLTHSLKLDICGLMNAPANESELELRAILQSLSHCTELQRLTLRAQCREFDAACWEDICAIVAGVTAAAYDTLQEVVIPGFTSLVSSLTEPRDSLALAWTTPLRTALATSNALRSLTFVDNSCCDIQPSVLSTAAARLHDHYLALPADVVIHLMAEEPREG